MKRKKFFIFDLDGTLLDNTLLGFARVNNNLIRLGLQPITGDFLRNHWGMPAKDLWDLICNHLGVAEDMRNDLKVNDLYLAKEKEHYSELSAPLIDAIIRLKDFGLFTGILTSRSGLSLESVVQQTGLDLTLFDYVQTLTHFPYHKPNGRVFGPAINWAMTKKMLPDDIVYFGATIKYDYAATLDANPPLDFVGIISGANTYEEFLAAGLPTCRITSFENLPRFLHHSIKELVEA